MRLWHYKLIPYLPNSQLLAQWRELNSIFKKQDKHILINYIYQYPKMDLLVYSDIVVTEMIKRCFHINNENALNYFSDIMNQEYKMDLIPFKNHHDFRYLKQCFYNLEEKYDRGQKDFSKEKYDALNQFMNEELMKEESF